MTLDAAKQLSENGFEVRLRIDPLVPIEGWQTQYSNLLDKIFSALRPERITLGSLRGLQSTINGATDRSWTKYLEERSNWEKKIRFEMRYEMYSWIIDELQEKYSFAKVGLCKETISMWKALGLDFLQIRCNCTW